LNTDNSGCHMDLDFARSEIVLGPFLRVAPGLGSKILLWEYITSSSSVGACSILCCRPAYRLDSHPMRSCFPSENRTLNRAASVGEDVPWDAEGEPTPSAERDLAALAREVKKDLFERNFPSTSSSGSNAAGFSDRPQAANRALGWP
jgi:hypothetical protein